MARKKQVKTPEQRLEEALVPCEEQPYAVPDNWCWARLGACINKTTEKQTVCTSEDLYIGLENMESGKGIISYGDASSLKSDKAVFHPGQVLYGRLRPYLDKHDVAKVEGICSTDILVYDVNPCSDARYINYLMSTSRFVRYASSCAKGVNLPRVSPADVERFAIPLPPLAEQRRIVERVEGLFAKLDEASQALNEMIGGSEERRSSMLRSAFNGDLTARWRAERGMGLDSWEMTTVGKCCRVGSGGTPSRKNPANYVGVIPWVKTGEIDWNRIVETEEHISQDALETSSAKLYQPGAVLVAMYGMGQTRGKAALLEIPAATNQAVCVLEPDERLDRRYLYYFFMRNYWDIREQSIGGNQLNLSGTIIKQYEICLPSIEEQRAIADILENALGKEALATSAAIERLESIQAIKQRILSDALRGRLDTNGSDDSSAKEQLLEMLEHQSAN